MLIAHAYVQDILTISNTFFRVIQSAEGFLDAFIVTLANSGLLSNINRFDWKGNLLDQTGRPG